MSNRISLALLGALVLSFSSLSVAEVKKLSAGAGPANWAGDLTPISKSDWTYERAGHLLERAGFGGTPEEIERLARMSPSEAVKYLVEYQKIDNPMAPFDESGVFDPAMIPDVNLHFDSFGEGIKAAYTKGEVFGVKPNPDGVRRYQPVVNQLYYRFLADHREWSRASVWWANRMLTTKRPLEEKLALFWHGHFATQDSKVDDYRLMLDQLDTLRRNGNGSFRDLLLGIARDPAMLIYLDNRRNVKGQANENFAREVMELFALGAGNYTEKDIKEAARAFTGWQNEGPKFVPRPDLHDDGQKTILGETGNFDGEGAIGVILRQKACAEFISRKLFRFLVREEISKELNAKLGGILRDRNYELKPLLTTIFLSRDFYSAESYATQIKSPVVLAVSTYKKLGLKEIPGVPSFPTVMANLGQELGNPPNVKGWDGGRVWINPSTLLARGNLARELLFPQGAENDAAVPERYKNADKAAAERDRMLMSGGQPQTKAGEGEQMMSALKAINSAPDYDLGLGVKNGYMKAFQRVKPISKEPARLDLAGMARAGGVKTASDSVDYFVRRMLRLPAHDADRATLIDFVKQQCGGDTIDFAAPATEKTLRTLVHLILSLPEYQLS